MGIRKNEVEGVLTVVELREAGYEYAPPMEMAFGMRTVIGKDGKPKKSAGPIMPVDFCIDRFNHVVLDIRHFDYKDKIH
jgi:hypothetical protein